MHNQIRNKGELDLAGVKIPCYVLEDGTRVLSGRKMQEALKMVDEGGSKSSGHRMTVFLSRKNISPFISKYLSVGTLNPIECYDGKQKIMGYRAEVLADICDVFLEARKTIDLSPRQQIIAEQCEILMRSFARVGIIALVDEATGYQYDRERNELQKILKAYISEELLPWQKRFPDIFYKELFRLNGWDYTVNGIKKRPGIIGKWTNILVYDQLPKGVLDELKKKAPRSKSGNKTARYHQYLTLDVGEPNLSNAINQAITIFLVSSSMKEMWSNFNRLKERQQGQLSLPFQIDFDEKGHLKEEKEVVKDEDTNKSELSPFDTSLKIALEYNPNKDKEPSK